MRNNRKDNSDWELRLTLYEERIFKWRLEGGINQGRHWRIGRRVLGQSKQKKRLGML